MSTWTASLAGMAIVQSPPGPSPPEGDIHSRKHALLSACVLLGVDAAGGSPQSCTHRFNQLFPAGLRISCPGHLYLFGHLREHHRSAPHGVSLTLSKDVTLTVSQHVFWRQNVNDAIYDLTSEVRQHSRRRFSRSCSSAPNSELHKPEFGRFNGICLRISGGRIFSRVRSSTARGRIRIRISSM